MRRLAGRLPFRAGLLAPEQWPVAIDGDRRSLERCATDHWIHERTGKQPLSVTTDRIAYAAMRAPGLLADYTGVTGEPVDRSGRDGLICEAYPDPVIRAFGPWPSDLAPRLSYKRSPASAVRRAILNELGSRAPWLALGTRAREACILSDDCLDALICALVARAAELGATMPIPSDSVNEAESEGWIHLPQPGTLNELAGSS